MCKIALWSDEHILNQNPPIFLSNFEFDRNPVSGTDARFGDISSAIPIMSTVQRTQIQNIWQPKKLQGIKSKLKVSTEPVYVIRSAVPEAGMKGRDK